MDSPSEAAAAVREVAGMEIDGRQVRVEVSNGTRRSRTEPVVPRDRPSDRDNRDYGRDRDNGRDRDFGRDGGRGGDYGRDNRGDNRGDSRGDNRGGRDFGRDRDDRDNGRRDRYILLIVLFASVYLLAAVHQVSDRTAVMRPGE
jgi:hypothetical protein